LTWLSIIIFLIVKFLLLFIAQLFRRLVILIVNIIPPGRSFACEKQIPIDSTKKLIGISYKFAEMKPKVN
jgi:hypothetical protein